MHLDGVDQYSQKVYFNVCRQEEEAKQGAGGTEDHRHLSAYNRRLRATQSPNCDFCYLFISYEMATAQCHCWSTLRLQTRMT